MRIGVKVMGHAVEYFPEDKRTAWTYEAEQGESVKDLIVKSGIKSELVMNVACKGRIIPKDTPLEDGMELLLFTPVSGG
ncbi:MAG TPA: MoaD/ThiS family protein [Bacillota bacterium]|nr:MoaD/ThiS family protein [Bacillota bacterium]